MENDVVFSDEVNEFCFFVFPPFFPVCTSFFTYFYCVRDITDWSVEPDIKHFAVGFFNRNRYAPVEVASNSTWLETVVEPAFYLTVDIRFPFFMTFDNPFAEPLFVLV